jgi:ribonucleoside-diphosphate reductase alpha chain
LGALRVLPDERILAEAGHAPPSPAALYAAVNLAAFVRSPFSAAAMFDDAACTASAALAVRLLEDAADLGGVDLEAPLRVGIIGLADALALLCHGFGDEAGQARAAGMLAAMHAGCTAATAQLREERGHCRDFRIVVEPHPRLCVLANNVADGVDPLSGENHVLELAFPEALATRRSSGFALTRRRYVPVGTCSETCYVFELPSPRRQLAQRAALRSWLQQPPATPLCVRTPPAPAESAELADQALAAGLPEPSWRLLHR